MMNLRSTEFGVTPFYLPRTNTPASSLRLRANPSQQAVIISFSGEACSVEILSPDQKLKFRTREKIPAHSTKSSPKIYASSNGMTIVWECTT